jgi:hypothetical protein
MPSPDPNNEADRAVIEGGGGEAEGFELAEAELIDHATHGDLHAAGRAMRHARDDGEPLDNAGEADAEWSSERPGDDR